MTSRYRFTALAALAFLAASATLHAQDPPASGVDRNTFDPAVRIQDDLFRHVNGAWLSTAEIPADQPFTGSFVRLRDEAEANVRALVEAAAAADHPAGSEARKIGDLYAAFMDEPRIESLGAKPIQADLAAIAGIKDVPGLLKLIGTLQRQGAPGLFGGFVDTDAKNSDRYIVYLNQSGLGLPDESYYREPKFEEIRKAYVAHIQKMLELAGIAEPAAKAAAVMALETRIASKHWDRVKNRDDDLTYNLLTRDALAKLAPAVDWAAWFAALGLSEVPAEVVVRQPSYVEGLDAILKDTPLEELKSWLTWAVVRSAAPMLSAAFVDESFAFYGKTLTGTQENRARWKRGVGAVENALGEAVGKQYVERHFPPEAKARMKVLVANLIAAYRESILSLDWMGEETKQKALTKLAKFDPKIGYPDKWRDYSALEITRDDLVGNMRRAAAFELARDLKKLGGPIDRTEWLMTPQTVNAYYNPGKNEIVFPAAILQPPFFDMTADDAVNYGGIGAVIGHEIGHGFDDQGSKYDGDGNLKNWWTDADRAEFEKRAGQLIKQYAGFSPAQLKGQYVNGELTIGENIGDLGGLTIAYKAYQLALGGKPAPVIDGLTGPQRLFIGWAQIWRSKYRDAELQRRLTLDPHSPPEFRCNGVIRNLPEFYEAFNVKQGDALWLPPEERVRIW